MQDDLETKLAGLNAAVDKVEQQYKPRRCSVTSS